MTDDSTDGYDLLPDRPAFLNWNFAIVAGIVIAVVVAFVLERNSSINYAQDNICISRISYHELSADKWVEALGPKVGPAGGSPGSTQ